MRILWVYAHPQEADAVALKEGLALGVGKVEAALQLTRRLATAPPEAVVNFGVAGAFAHHGLEVGSLCLVCEETMADEGVLGPGGFEDTHALGLAGPQRWRADRELTDRLAAALFPLVPHGVPRVRGATVSTCSGTDALASEYARRVGAAVETMEGAAVARVCEAFGLPWAQLRSISNRTGDRRRGGWDLKAACARLREAVEQARSILALDLLAASRKPTQ